MKTKTSAFEKYLENNKILTDYFASIKFYDKYKKELAKKKPNEKNLAKYKEEVEINIKSGLDTLHRFERVFGAMQEALETEIKRQQYPRELDKDNGVEKLREFIKNLERIKTEINVPTATATPTSTGMAISEELSISKDQKASGDSQPPEAKEVE